MASVPATTHAARFLPSFSILNDTGANVEHALSRAKFSSQILYEPETVVPARSLWMFVARIARKEGIESLPFLAAQNQDFALLETWAKTHLLGAATLAEMLQRYCMIAGPYNTYNLYAVHQDERLARICCTLTADVGLEKWLGFSNWSNVTLFNALIRYALGEAYEPTAITLQTKGPISPEISHYLGTTRLLQGWTCSSVVFPKRLLATPLPDVFPTECPPELKVPEAPEELSFSTVMRQLIKPCLSESWLDIHAAADMSGSSVRTFQRRLTQSGLTYKKLLEQTRMEVARSLLKDDDCKVIDVAHEVGYQDPTHFSRAFRRSHGLTPTEYRNTANQP